jgi:hypothetical protein
MHVFSRCYISRVMYVILLRRPHSSVGIATRYGLNGFGIKSLWERDFTHPSRLTLWPTQPSIQLVQGLSRG